MSRFFEALKQASQFLDGLRDEASLGASPSPGKLENSDLTAILSQTEDQTRERGIGNREQGAIEATAVIGSPAATYDSPLTTRQEAIEAAAVIGSPAVEPLAASAEAPLISHGSLPQNGSFGILTEAALDRRAKLIPNAVEPIVLEYYRAVRTKIMQRRQEKMFRSLLVTSANPKEGKTVTALNLALTFSMLPAFKVLVVDGDLRNGQLSEWLGIETQPGLANLLEGSARLNEVVLKSARIPFYFMSRGSSELSPPELLHTSRWRNHSQKMAEHFDLVLVDSPPVNPVTDAQLLAYGCDALVLVARAFHTSQGTLEKLTTHELRPFRVVGTILNGGATNGHGRYYSYYPTRENGNQNGKSEKGKEGVSRE